MIAWRKLIPFLSLLFTVVVPSVRSMAAEVTPVISGYVRTTEGAGVQGVTVSTNIGAVSDVTDADGYYELPVTYGWGGSVAPSQAGSVFDPPSRSYTSVVGNQTDQNYTIVLRLTDMGASLVGVSSCSAAWGDYDNDGDLDLALAGSTANGRISKIYRNTGGSFTDIGANLTGVDICSLAWGDYDNDGDLDLALAGSTANTRISRIYRNTDGDFTDIGAGLIGVENSSFAWGDYDNDGDLDLALAGIAESGFISRIYRNDAGSFTDIGAGLTGVAICSLAWGDYDNDGDLDLALAGYNGDLASHYVSKIYRNTGGSFTEIGAGLVGVSGCSLAWGDYDNDGDLDLALAGSWGNTRMSKIYRNTDGDFTDIGANLTGVWLCSLAWGDYDNDGDLDFALAGTTTGSTRISKIYRNVGGTFEDTGANLIGVSYGSLAWGDYDSDGDIDLAISGDSGSGFISRIYRNDSFKQNAVPLPPAGLSSSVTGGTVTFNWNAATDAETPTQGLNYNLRVGTAPGKDDVFSGMANAATGLRKIPALGNAQKRLSWTGNNMPAGALYWSVQAVDTAYAGSAWANDQTVSVPGLLISGYVKTSVHSGVAGITITATNGGGTNTTATDGYYQLMVPTGWSGTVTPSKSEYSFDPTSKTYTSVTSDQAGQDFTTCQWPTDIGAGLMGVGFCSSAWGDYDNDGDLDLALAGYPGSGIISISRIYRNDGGSFTDIGAGLTGVDHCSLAWGDYDNDGDLDLALAGCTTGNTYVSKIYRNTSGAFTDIGAGLIGVYNCSLAWGDYDNDGDLDLAIAGNTQYSGTDYRSIIYRNDGGTFTDIGAGLVGVTNCSLAWGDYDNDGDLDLALAGSGLTPGGGHISMIYKNTGGTFMVIGANLAGVDYCSLAWGDYDNDGDLDLALAGNPAYGGPTSKIYRNDGGGTFTDIGAGLTAVDYCSLAWGDYDNDGDLDLALAGKAWGTNISKIYRNDSGTFTDIGVGLRGTYICSLAWGDYDNDGDLDLAIAGGSFEIGYLSKIYRNENLRQNVAPASPEGLSSTVTGGTVTFNWSAATDAETPAKGLSYSLRVGTAPGKDDVFSGMAGSTGLREIPALGNVQKRLSWTIKNLQPSTKTYYWSVQAVDTAYAGSAWASEQIAGRSPDTTSPVIGTVIATPALVAVGDVIHVTANATDNIAVKSVTASGVALQKTGDSTWYGDILALPSIGLHAVTVVVTDTSGNQATDGSLSYTTADVYGTSCSSTTHQIFSSVCGRSLFKLWGKVTIINPASFWLDDGSKTRVKVIAPSYAGIVDGDVVSATGILNPNAVPPTLTCPAGKVTKLRE